MPLSIKPLFRLLLPLLLLLASVAAIKKVELLDSVYLVLFGLLPYLLLTLPLGLAHYFNRSRYFFAAIVLAITYWLIQTHLQTSLSEASALYLYTAISLLAPLALLILIVVPERGLWNFYGLIPLLTIAILLMGAYGLHQQIAPDDLRRLVAIFPIDPYPDYVLSLVASGWFAITLLAAVLFLSHRDAEAEASLSGCIIFVFSTLAFFDQLFISTIMFSAAALALTSGLLRSSHEMAFRDDLTGLLGRRALNEKLRSLRKSYSIAMLDIDHFKKFNDQHGHDVGDDVLKIVATQVSKVAGGGIPYRYGGEEFAIIFAGRDLESCIPHLEAVRSAIDNYSIALRDQTTRPKSRQEGTAKRGKSKRRKTVSVTVSIGLAEHSEENNKPDQVLKTADKALYKAKQSGRNCVYYRIPRNR
jgi:diguanylate cyclase (GGDEF)-like protein